MLQKGPKGHVLGPGLWFREAWELGYDIFFRSLRVRSDPGFRRSRDRKQFRMVDTNLGAVRVDHGRGPNEPRMGRL